MAKNIKLSDMKYIKTKKIIKLADGKINGYRCIVLNLGSHPVAYIGVTKDSLLYNVEYDDLGFIDVHGGLTYSEEGDGKYLPKDYYWFGWDYAHAGDYFNNNFYKGDKRWTTEEIIEECWHVSYAFEMLDKLLDKIKVRLFIIKRDDV